MKNVNLFSPLKGLDMSEGSNQGVKCGIGGKITIIKPERSEENAGKRFLQSGGGERYQCLL